MCRLIAIAVEKKNGFNSPINPRFGCANAFVIADTDTGDFIDEFDNVYAGTTQEAGIATAMSMYDNIIDAVISGGFEPSTRRKLEELGIEMWVAPDITAKEAVGWFGDGALEPVIS